MKQWDVILLRWDLYVLILKWVSITFLFDSLQNTGKYVSRGLFELLAYFDLTEISCELIKFTKRKTHCIVTHVFVYMMYYIKLITYTVYTRYFLIWFRWKGRYSDKVCMSHILFNMIKLSAILYTVDDIVNQKRCIAGRINDFYCLFYFYLFIIRYVKWCKVHTSYVFGIFTEVKGISLNEITEL